MRKMSFLKKNMEDQRKEEIVEKLLISLIESWNDKHVKSRINQELISMIKQHMDYSYTVGVEDTFKSINEQFEKYYPIHVKSLSYILMQGILDHKNY